MIVIQVYSTKMTLRQVKFLLLTLVVAEELAEAKAVVEAEAVAMAEAVAETVVEEVAVALKIASSKRRARMDRGKWFLII